MDNPNPNSFRLRGGARSWFDRILRATIGKENIVVPPPSGLQPPLEISSTVHPVIVVNRDEVGVIEPGTPTEVRNFGPTTDTTDPNPHYSALPEYLALVVRPFQDYGDPPVKVDVESMPQADMPQGPWKWYGKNPNLCFYSQKIGLSSALADDAIATFEMTLPRPGTGTQYYTRGLLLDAGFRVAKASGDGSGFFLCTEMTLRHLDRESNPSKTTYQPLSWLRDSNPWPAYGSGANYVNPANLYLAPDHAGNFVNQSSVFKADFGAPLEWSFSAGGDVNETGLQIKLLNATGSSIGSTAFTVEGYAVTQYWSTQDPTFPLDAIPISLAASVTRS